MGTATLLIQQNGVTITPVVTVTPNGVYQQSIITGLAAGPYSFTIQNVTPGVALPSAIRTSATVNVL